jgi:spermidine synthase
MRLDESLNDAAGVYFEGALVESLQTPLQLIEVFDTPALGKLMRIDGANMTSERDEFFYHEALIHPAAITHADPRKVLIIGGGDGGSAEEVLKHPSVEHVLVAELDQGVIDIARKYFHAVHHDVFANPKLELRIGDGAALVRTTTDRFDLVYLDLTDPDGPAEALYTQSFQADLKKTLAPGGALVMHIGSAFSHPDRVLGSLANLRRVFSLVVPYFVHIPIYGATWGFAVASDTLDPGAISAEEIETRLQERRIVDRQLYNGDMHQAMLALPGYIRTLIG